MSAVDDILSQIPMSELARQLGVDEQTAESAARQAIPTLLGGMQANAHDPGGERSLAGALDEHASDSLLDGGVSLDQVDTRDGTRIVSNIFGGNSDQVVQALGARAGGDQSMMQKLLPILAPIVLAYLAKRMQGGKYGDLLGPILAGAAGGSLADVLGDMLGNRGGQNVPQQPAPTQSQDSPFNTPQQQNASQQQQQPAEHGEGGLMDALKDMLGFGRRQ